MHDLCIASDDEAMKEALSDEDVLVPHFGYGSPVVLSPAEPRRAPGRPALPFNEQANLPICVQFLLRSWVLLRSCPADVPPMSRRCPIGVLLKSSRLLSHTDCLTPNGDPQWAGAAGNYATKRA